MTQSLNQTSITDVTSRRHNDPPGLWIAVVTSSVALHLLLFWLMRYSNAFSPWFPPTSEAFIPIEIIKISPSSSKPQLKAKTVSPRSANQQSSTARSTQKSPVTPTNENSDAINFGAIRRQRRNTFASKPNTQLVPKQSVPTPTPRFTSTPTVTPTPTQIPTDSLGNLRWKRDRERISLGKPTPLPKFTPVEPRQPTSEDSQIPSRRNRQQPTEEDSPIPNRRNRQQPTEEDSPIPNRRTPRQSTEEDSPIPNRRTPRQPTEEDSPIPSRRTPRQPTEEDSPIPSRRTPRQPIGEDSQIPNRRTPRQPTEEDSQIPSSKTPQPPTGVGIIASWDFLSREEQKSRMGSPLPEGLILPEHIGSNQKQINSLSLQPNLDLPEGEFLASLVIDKAGNFVQAVVVDSPAPGKRRKYEEFINSIFQGEKFQPARNQNGTPVPELVNRFVRIRIQRP